MKEDAIADFERRHVGKDKGGVLATQRGQQLEEETVDVVPRELLQETVQRYFRGDECEDGRAGDGHAVEERQQRRDRQLLQPLELTRFVSRSSHSYLHTSRSSDTHTRRSEGAGRHPPHIPPPPFQPAQSARC